jgi:hypothetical protein
VTAARKARVRWTTWHETLSIGNRSVGSIHKTASDNFDWYGPGGSRGYCRSRAAARRALLAAVREAGKKEKR